MSLILTDTIPETVAKSIDSDLIALVVDREPFSVLVHKGDLSLSKEDVEEGGLDKLVFEALEGQLESSQHFSLEESGLVLAVEGSLEVKGDWDIESVYLEPLELSAGLCFWNFQ